MTGVNIIQGFLQQATATGSKSTVLKPLGWAIAICISAMLSAAFFKLASWMIIFFAILTGLLIILYFFSYIYCLCKDRDALRSESYSIQKMAIEKGMVGDDTSGVFEVKKDPQGHLIEVECSQKEESK